MRILIQIKQIQMDTTYVSVKWLSTYLDFLSRSEWNEARHRLRLSLLLLDRAADQSDKVRAEVST